MRAPKIDQEACVGSQDCVMACPEVFKMEGEKQSFMSQKFQKRRKINVERRQLDARLLRLVSSN